MKLFLGLVAMLAAVFLLGDCFAKEMTQNQVIATAGVGIISSIFYFVIRFEEVAGYHLKVKSDTPSASIGVSDNKLHNHDERSKNRLIR